MWARDRQPGQVAYGIALGHERFSPRELLGQAVEAERAGFDIVACSGHLTPWWDPAGGPVVMAQQAATLELMNPGRAFLAVGSGEAMNEVPAGLRWPSPAGQLARSPSRTASTT
jgi:coenzyme F420-dependent glucose-6-phosphate dehydrogenase